MIYVFDAWTLVFQATVNFELFCGGGDWIIVVGVYDEIVKEVRVIWCWRNDGGGGHYDASRYGRFTGFYKS